MTDRKVRVTYPVKGRLSNLKPRGSKGIKIPVECLNLKTQKVKHFGSLSEAERYLQEHLDTDKSLITIIGTHVRKSTPTPVYGHLWRVSTSKVKPWPDYSHLDLSSISEGNVTLVYPIYGLDVKTKTVYKFASYEDVCTVIDITGGVLSSYIRTGYIYRRTMRFALKKKDLFAVKTKKPSLLYTYEVYNTLTRNTRTCLTSTSLAKLLGAPVSSINCKFFYHQANVIYCGKDNRYRITRTPRN